MKFCIVSSIFIKKSGRHFAFRVCMHGICATTLLWPETMAVTSHENCFTSRTKGTMVTYGGMSRQPVTVPTVCEPLINPD